MDDLERLNDFYDVIDGFNAQGISLIRKGDIKDAIEIYRFKCKFVVFAHMNEIISNEIASTMITDNNSIIKSLMKGVRK